VSEARIPFWYTKLGAAESEAVARCIRDGRLSQGPVTEEFEQELASFLGVPHVVATTSGSAALYLAAAGLGIRAGDEVIVPDRTFMATAHAMMLAGANVRLVDAEPNRTVIDASLIEAAITSRTKAIVPVHLNGNAADIRTIRRIAAAHGLFVIEDAAQAFGSRSVDGYLGTRTDAGCFSLGVTKLITTGQGGFVATHDLALAQRMRAFRSHGVHDTYDSSYEHFGFNLKFTDIAASIGLIQLGKVAAKIDAHRSVYDFYRKALNGLDFVRVSPVDSNPGCVPLWTEAFVADRKRVILMLDKGGIQVRPFLPSLHVSSYLGSFDDNEFPHSNAFGRQGIFLPSGPDMPDEWLERVAAAFQEIAPLIGKDVLDPAGFARATISRGSPPAREHQEARSQC